MRGAGSAGLEPKKMDKISIPRHPRGVRPKSRTSNACEACKKRKTKCSGLPGPCSICEKADTYCNFNPKLDTRRKSAYSSSTIQDRQQFMIAALLQTIKHIPEKDLDCLIRLIRRPAKPDDVALLLHRHFKELQSKGKLPNTEFDHSDIISFGLQGLCGHRKGRPQPSGASSCVLEDSAVLDGSESGSESVNVSSPIASASESFDDEHYPVSHSSMAHGSVPMLDMEGFSSSQMFELAVEDRQDRHVMDKLPIYGHGPYAPAYSQPSLQVHGAVPQRYGDLYQGLRAQSFAMFPSNASPIEHYLSHGQGGMLATVNPHIVSGMPQHGEDFHRQMWPEYELKSNA